MFGGGGDGEQIDDDILVLANTQDGRAVSPTPLSSISHSPSPAVQCGAIPFGLMCTAVSCMLCFFPPTYDKRVDTPGGVGVDRTIRSFMWV